MKVSKKLLAAAAFATPSEATTTSEMLDFYNANVERFLPDAQPVKKFASRAVGEQRCAALAAAIVAASQAPADRSAAVAATWANPAVKAARAARHAVVVAGSRYASVRAAFDALGLELRAHTRVRAELVAKGVAEFGGHKFALAPAAAAA